MQLTDYVTNKASNNLIPEFSLYCNFMADGSFYQKGLTKGFPYAICSCYCILCYNKKGGSKFPVDFATKAPYESLYSSDSESSSGSSSDSDCTVAASVLRPLRLWPDHFLVS